MKLCVGVSGTAGKAGFFRGGILRGGVEKCLGTNEELGHHLGAKAQHIS